MPATCDLDAHVLALAAEPQSLASARRTSTPLLVPRPPTSTHQWLALQLNTPPRRRLDVARRASALSASHSFESAGSIHEVPVYLRAHLCGSRLGPICEELVLRRRPGLSAAALYIVGAQGDS